MENWTNAKLCDVANLILGAVLLVSPWMFSFDAGTVSINAYVTGIVIAALAIAALAAFAVWEEWLNLVVGLWALVSPWVLGFQGTTARQCMWSSRRRTCSRRLNSDHVLRIRPWDYGPVRICIAPAAAGGGV